MEANRYQREENVSYREVENGANGKSMIQLGRIDVVPLLFRSAYGKLKIYDSYQGITVME